MSQNPIHTHFCISFNPPINAVGNTWETWIQFLLCYYIHCAFFGQSRLCVPQFPYWLKRIVVVESLSCVQLFRTPWTAACQASLSFTIFRSLLKLMSIESAIPSNHLILCCPLLLPFNLSQHQGLFQWVGSSHQVAKVLELQLQHQSFQWVFRVDFL